MTEKEQAATLTVCFMAAFADGTPDPRERDEIQRIAGSLAEGADLDFASLYQDAVRRRRSLSEVAQDLVSPEARRRAYELAVCVAGADGACNQAEKRFLEDLRQALGLEAGPAREFAAEADAIAGAPLGAPGTAGAAPATPPDPAALDRTILNYSILNGALELLPESLATMAIIPLQMKLVYEVGQAHGHSLDRGHVVELLATVGVGVTGQAVEQVGRKILGGILGSIGGGLLGGLGRQAASSGVAFATTYAIGQVAREYYASGRKIDAAQLKQVFQRMLEEARGLAGSYGGQIAEKARTLDVSRIVEIVKRGA